MPTYEYLCDACGHKMELFQSMRDDPKKDCPECGELKLRRLISGGGGFIFKGSGFYITDYRSDSYKKAAAGDSKPSESKSSDSGSSSSTDSGSKSSSASNNTAAS